MMRLLLLVLVIVVLIAVVEARAEPMSFAYSGTATVDEQMDGYWYVYGNPTPTVVPVHKTYTADISGNVVVDFAALNPRVSTFDALVTPEPPETLMGDDVRPAYYYGWLPPYPADKMTWNTVTVGAGTAVFEGSYHLWGEADPASGDLGAWGHPHTDHGTWGHPLTDPDRFYAGTSVYGPDAPENLAGLTYDFYYDHWVGLGPLGSDMGMTLTLTGDWTGESDFDFDKASAGQLLIQEYYAYWEIIHAGQDIYDTRTLMFQYEVPLRTVVYEFRNEVPEPGTAVLLGAAALGAIGVRLRPRRS